jgi:hypothetical protein
MQRKKELDFFDKPKNIKKLWILLYASCALTLVLDLFASRVPHFGFDSLFGFSAILGFVACAALILFAKLIASFLRKGENYYDE